eukprot:scaffold182653_cov33-Tisochrysis_lutea.AAC.1
MQTGRCGEPCQWTRAGRTTMTARAVIISPDRPFFCMANICSLAIVGGDHGRAFGASRRPVAVE